MLAFHLDVVGGIAPDDLAVGLDVLTSGGGHLCNIQTVNWDISYLGLKPMKRQIGLITLLLFVFI